MTGDLYRILGVRTDASAETIRKAYRRRAAKHHPDRNPGDEDAVNRFRQIRHAYDVLSDPDRRKKYDATGDHAEPRTTEDSQLAAILVPIMIETMHSVASNTFGTGLKKTDIVRMMKERLKRQINGNEEQVGRIQKSLKELRTALGRFSMKDGGPNLLDEAVRNQIATGEQAEAEAKATSDILTRAYNYLDGVKYRVDGGKEESGHESRELLGQFFGVLT